MGDFRPIALCNTTYKIVTKIIANHLKKVLRKIISDGQSGFSPRSSIVEGIIISHEVIHMVRKNRHPSMVIKLDILKAYDLVDIHFLLSILRKFVFGDRWVEWINSCISTPKFLVLVNGVAHDLFGSSRGIRQGDPLSPFLFIIMVEALDGAISHLRSIGQ